MEVASELLPIILYTLLSILIIFIIVFVYKLIRTLDKTNEILDDVNGKVKKLDGLFEVIDKSADTINMITNRAVEVVIGAVSKLFKKKRKDEEDE